MASIYSTKGVGTMQTTTIGETLVGTYELLSFEIRKSDGSVVFPLGEDAVGRISYDDAGRMAVQVMRPGRPKFASGDMLAGSPEEIAAAWAGYIGYSGSYIIDEAAGTVTHEIAVSSFPNWVGDNQVRFFEFDGDTLELSTAPLMYDGVGTVATLVWERV